MREQEIEPWLEPAASLHALGYALDDPETGVEFAARIGNEQIRLPTIGQIVREWLLIDEPVASAWLDASDLSQRWKDGIRKIPAATRRKHQKRTARKKAIAEARGEGTPAAEGR